MRFVGRTLIVLVPLGLIGVGLWLMYPPLAPIVVGGLIWRDLTQPSGAGP